MERLMKNEKIAKFIGEKLKLYSYFKDEYLWWNKMFQLTYKEKIRTDYQWTFENFYKKIFSGSKKPNIKYWY